MGRAIAICCELPANRRSSMGLPWDTSFSTLCCLFESQSVQPSCLGFRQDWPELLISQVVEEFHLSYLDGMRLQGIPVLVPSKGLDGTIDTLVELNQEPGSILLLSLPSIARPLPSRGLRRLPLPPLHHALLLRRFV